MTTRKKHTATKPAVRQVVGYTRVSTREQADSGLSLTSQHRRIMAWIKAQGLALGAIHSDEGISGRSTKRRAALEVAIDQVCRAKGVLVVYSLSRLARSAADAEQICERLTSHGADLVSLTEPIDTTTAMGRAFFGIVTVFARLESDLTGERIREVLEHKRLARKRWWSSITPYGWRMSADDSHVVQVRAEQTVIAKMRRWRREGRGFGWIARRLERDGVRTKTGNRRWQRMTILKILRIDQKMQAEKRNG